MLEEYLAKSSPRETVQEHTDRLLENFKVLKELYLNIDIKWELLYKACLYHDLGKINSKFQKKLKGRGKDKNEVPHGLLSLAFIDFETLEEDGYSEKDIQLLFNSIAHHHERDFNIDEENLNKELELLSEEYEKFSYDKLHQDYINDYIEEQFFSIGERIHEKKNFGEDNKKQFFQYILLKGLLNRLDYAASAHIKVEKPNNFLIKDLEKMLKEWQIKNKEADFNELQKYMIENRENNVIAIAQTGMGKTEAGLLWIGDNKGFFTLPLKTAINAIYDRIRDKIITENREDRVGLLHSDTLAQYLKNDESKDDDYDLYGYYEKTKQLTLPLTICTLDQIFDFVYRYKGFEPKLATLAYSKIVIDEIQMYSPDLLAYLILGLHYITKLGGKFAILTATLPGIIENLLEKQKIEYVKPEKPFINDMKRHSVKIIDDEINVDEIIDKYRNNKVLVICNTVKVATKICIELKDRLPNENINLFHSAFTKGDRKEKEDAILKMGSKDNKTDYGIWVTTQVVEASLDIDFDVLLTELSDLNGLFQRMGRCYRAREFREEKAYNCYVFNGGDKKCSGVGAFIYEDIFDKCKSILKGIDGYVTESEKIDLISEVYSLESLKDSNYYKEIEGHIRYVNSIESYELDKKEMRERFRNIDSQTIIPRNVYEDNEKEIHKNIKILMAGYPKDISSKERDKVREDKIIAKEKISKYFIDLPGYLVRNTETKTLKISPYENVEILECTYDKEFGTNNYIKKEKAQSVENNFF